MKIIPINKIMNQQILTKIQEKYGKKNPPQLKAGDTVRVHEKVKEKDKERIQIFEGLVLATKHGSGMNGSYTVRKLAVGNVNVEKVFPLHSPNVVKIERLKTADTKRAKIYYMRDRSGKASKMKGEKTDYMLWEEPEAKKEMEEIKEQVAEEAEQAAEEKADEEEASKDNKPDKEPEKKPK